MRWSSNFSENPVLTNAVREVCTDALNTLKGHKPDLAIAFVSSQYSSEYSDAANLFGEMLGAKTFIGCSTEGVISKNREFQNTPAVTLVAAHIPNVKVLPFEIQESEMPNADAPQEHWRSLISDTQEKPAAICLLPDPFTINVEDLLAGLDFAYPDTVKFGGLASGGKRAGDLAVFVQNSVRRGGVTGLAFFGNIEVETIVAHSCRPVGPQMVVTKARENVILELNDKDPLEMLGEMFEEAEKYDKDLLTSRSVQIGVPADRLASEIGIGDFLIRNILGINGAESSITVGDRVSEGQIVQFHAMDEKSANEELEATLEEYGMHKGVDRTRAALLFTCLGRGENLFGTANHDAMTFEGNIPNIPLAGFFSNGQISSKNGQSLLHGYTATFAMFKVTKSEETPLWIERNGSSTKPKRLSAHHTKRSAAD